MLQKSPKKNYNQFLVFALQDGKLVHINGVENGLKSNCICPSCNSPLVAKNKGQIKRPHFAHSTNEECKYSPQTALHLAAKAVLEKVKYIMLPGCEIFVKKPSKIPYLPLEKPPGYTLKYCNSLKLDFDEVILEKKLHEFIPDVVVIKDGVRLIVEIAVTHFVGRDKLKKIEDANISAIEINLSESSSDFSFDDIIDLVIESVEHKTWLFNRKAEIDKKKREAEEIEKFNQALKEEEEEARKTAEKRRKEETFYRNYYKPIVFRKNKFGETLRQIDNCPVEKRQYLGQYYANVNADCAHCEYYRGSRDSGKFGICLYDYYNPK